MGSTHPQRAVHILGGGVVGLVLGVRLARAGHPTTIYDPASLGDNASGIAAGMLAPASEALELAGSSFERLRRARDLWPELAASIGLSLDPSGALHAVPASGVASLLAKLRAIGACAERTAGPAWIAGPMRNDGVWTPEDWRLEPRLALAALHRAYLAAGGGWIARRVASASELSDLRRAAEVVVAMGWGGAACLAFAPEMAALTPIKGQILRLKAGPHAGVVVRHRDVYLAPGHDGLVIGATMEAGASDRALDPVKLGALQATAGEITPEFATSAFSAEAGVRAATPDAWPLVGRSSTGVWLSVGARRNGWLLAPLMAEVLHAQLDGRPHPDAQAFSPARFGAR